MAICTSVAKAGAPFFVRCAKGRKAGRSSPITIVTRGPIHIIALTVETRPIEISASTRRPPPAPKILTPAICATLILPERSAIGVVSRNTALSAT